MYFPSFLILCVLTGTPLLNNYALIPGPEPKTVKVINMNAGKNPRSEGLPLYASRLGLPESEPSD